VQRASAGGLQEPIWNCPTRVAYIPTAAQAFDAGSDKSPGLQRRRARAAAKREAARLKDALSAERVEVIDLSAIADDEAADGAGRLHAVLEGVLRPADGRGICYVEGGNTFWLVHEARRSGLLSCLPTLLRDTFATYVGVSAGAILAGETCETVRWKGWDDPSVVPAEFFESPMTGLGLVGAAFPHHGQEWEETVQSRRGELGDLELHVISNGAQVVLPLRALGPSEAVG